ncbi:MAG: hypothetical protein Edafosvirus2_57 [Edafosvirus sp.]|uniref:Fatty acid desaturase domain-containing protein n=1 Tax=Edafosvirus sp. TaxID=2487765 RepID=A0A3G4ZSL1_9VIRU|nr:MAG: hypothetical protein Edafosvirus2_57 [Edafosvirus sp.]
MGPYICLFSVVINWTIIMKKIITIEGVSYDVTKFKHPGGQKMIDLAINSPYATELFQTHHFNNTKILNKLKQLPIIKKGTEEKNKNYPWNCIVYNGLQKFVSEQFEKKNKSYHNATIYWAITCIFLFLCHMILLMCKFFYMAIPFGAMFSIHMGFTIYHYIHHGGLYKKYPTIAKLLEFFMNMSTYHGDDWKQKHNGLHHVNVNNPDIDDDIASGMPYIRLHKTQPKQWYHEYQHIYVWFLYALYGPIVIFKGKLNKEKWFYPIMDIGLYMILPAYLNDSLWMSFVSYMLTKIFAGIIFITFFSVSHNNIDIYNNNMKNTDYRGWGRIQIEESVNWGGKIICFLLGGINYQIEHHLFPNIHPMYYPEISKIVKNYCDSKPYGITVNYIHYASFWESFMATYKYIKLMGNL